MTHPNVYRSSDEFINRQLELASNKKKRRLELDIADILTGPTSAGNAQHLADSLCTTHDPQEVAERLKEAAERYLQARPYAGSTMKPVQTKKRFREITQEDVGKALFEFNGRKWKASEFIGRILKQDVGKRVYLVGDILQVENDEQRAKRLKK